MKKIVQSSVLYLLTLFLGSCAPKVLTEIKSTHTPIVTAQEVHLYEVGDSVPQSAKLIGRVKVLDSGLSTQCQYDQVIALAKKRNGTKRWKRTCTDRASEAVDMEQLPPDCRKYAIN